MDATLSNFQKVINGTILGPTNGPGGPETAHTTLLVVSKLLFCGVALSLILLPCPVSASDQLLPCPPSAQDNRPKLHHKKEKVAAPQFVIDSGTLESRLPSPRSMVQFYRNYQGLGRYVFDWTERWVYGTSRPGVDNSHWWTQVRRGLQAVVFPFTGDGETFINPSGYVFTTGWETVHEYAHRTRGALFGVDGGFNPDFHDFGDNPYSFSFHLFRTNNKTGANVWRNGRIRQLHSQPPFLSGDQSSLIAASAGINQQVNLARNHVRNHVLEGDYFDISTFYSYYVNAASYFLYNDDLIEYLFGKRSNALRDDPVGDRAGMIEAWKRLGRNYDDRDLARNQLITTAVSGTTWSYIFGTWGYVAKGKRKARILRLGGFL